VSAADSLIFVKILLPEVFVSHQQTREQNVKLFGIKRVGGQSKAAASGPSNFGEKV
jgi:hypothetical protein